MTFSRHKFYEMGEPFGDGCTRIEDGALICGGGGGGSSTTSQGIPAEYKPLANAYAQRAMDLSNQQFTPYGGQRFAGMNGTQQQAGDFYRQQMSAGTNPYLDQMVNRAQGNIVTNFNNTIRPQLDAMAARSGSFGNSGVGATTQQAQQALGNQLSDVATQMYGGQYNADQASRFNAAQGLMAYGGQQQQNQQNQLDFNYQQFQDALNQPYKNLQTLGAPLQGNILGQVQTTTQKGK